MNETPKCQRGDHLCAELCSTLHGQPCQPPDDSTWRPRSHGDFGRGSAVSNYRVLRSAIPATTISERGERALRWLAGFDDPTAIAFAELFRTVAGAPESEPTPGKPVCGNCGSDNQHPAASMPPGTWSCGKCGAVWRKRNPHEPGLLELAAKMHNR